MNLSVSVISEIPIYEQIKNQIREKVLTGELEAATMLPSIRSMARELKVGIITVKRAYQDLCDEGVLISQPGKGIFVVELDTDRIKEKHEAVLSEQLRDVKTYADSVGVGKEAMMQLLEEIYREK